MSARGPPELCAIKMVPAAMLSTHEMPKCSFHMVCNDTSDEHNRRLSSATSTLTQNSTASCTPNEMANCRNAATRASSPESRHPPTRYNLGDIEVPVATRLPRRAEGEAARRVPAGRERGVPATTGEETLPIGADATPACHCLRKREKACN